MSSTRRALSVERRAIWPRIAPEPKKCSHCGKKGHLAKDCWEKHPDKKPTAKPKAKAQPTKPAGRGKGRGKGGRKSKGRGKGNKF